MINLNYTELSEWKALSWKRILGTYFCVGRSDHAFDVAP